MKYIVMSIVYWFYNFFVILEIKVALISYSLSMATSKVAKNKGPIGLISRHSAPCWQYPNQSMGKPDDGYHSKQLLPVVVGLMGVSPYW